MPIVENIITDYYLMKKSEVEDHLAKLEKFS